MWKEISNKLLENVPLLIIIMGLIIFLLGAAGGWNKVGIIIHGPQQSLVQIIGIILSLFGAILLWRKYSSRQEFTRSRQYYEISIENLEPKDEVTSPVLIKGKFKNKPKKPQELFVFNQPEGSIKYHLLKVPKVNFIDENKSWSAVVNVGGKEMLKDLVFVVAGKCTKALINYYKDVQTETGEGVGITENHFPPDWVECARVTVKFRKKDENK